jgi:type II secretion system protein N
LAFFLFFPLQPFSIQLEQLVKKQGVTLEVKGPKLLFPLGLGAEELEISHPQIIHPPFQLQDVDLRPLWTSLIGSNPGLSFELKAYQGTISGTASRSGEVQIGIDRLQINEPLGAQLPLILEGILVRGDFDGVLPLVGKNQSRMQLEFDELRIKGMKNLGSSDDLLQLGRLTGTAEAKGPVVQISNLTATGPAFDLKGSGTLRVGRTPASSSLNLSLVLSPKAGLDPMLNDLLSLTKKPQADGSYQFSLRGALAKLRFN